MVSRADLDAWQGYVSEECRRFYAHCEGVTYIFKNDPRAVAFIARARVKSSEELAFTGRWDIVRPHLTEEFRHWVEEFEATERLTLTDWVARAKTERDAVDFLESAGHTLGQLRELARLTRERDALICEAASRGASKTGIAEAVGISRQQVHTIVNRGGSGIAPVIPIGSAHGAPVDAGAEEAPTEWVRMASGELVEVF